MSQTTDKRAGLNRPRLTSWQGRHAHDAAAGAVAGSVDLLCCAGSMNDVQPRPTMHQGTAPVASITEGDTVIFDVNGEKQAFVTVKKTG